MKVTKKEQWMPVRIELETAKELESMRRMVGQNFNNFLHTPNENRFLLSLREALQEVSR